MKAEGPSKAMEGQAGSRAHGPAPVPVPRELMKAPLTLNLWCFQGSGLPVPIPQDFFMILAKATDSLQKVNSHVHVKLDPHPQLVQGPLGF